MCPTYKGHLGGYFSSITTSHLCAINQIIVLAMDVFTSITSVTISEILPLDSSPTSSTSEMLIPVEQEHDYGGSTVWFCAIA